MPTTRRSLFRSIAPRAAACLAVIATAALASCSDPVGPDVEGQSTPFYYYEDEKIYLQVVGSMLTAAPEVEGDTASIRAALAQAGMPADSIRPLWVPGHWFVHLPTATSARRAEYAARQLRLDAGVRFASAVYRGVEANCPLYLVNRLVVQFQPGADPGAIDRLNAAAGVRNEQVNPFGQRWYEYPERMAATPLELAAHYHRQQIVDWADADRIHGCMRLDGRQAP